MADTSCRGPEKVFRAAPQLPSASLTRPSFSSAMARRNHALVVDGLKTSAMVAASSHGNIFVNLFVFNALLHHFPIADENPLEKGGARPRSCSDF